MIEYVTCPPNIGKLSPEEDYSFYFEVFGEASPRITSEYTQASLPEEDAGLKQCINFAPLYEYYWSLGFVDLDGKCGPGTWGGRACANRSRGLFLLSHYRRLARRRTCRYRKISVPK